MAARVLKVENHTVNVPLVVCGVTEPIHLTFVLLSVEYFSAFMKSLWKARNYQWSCAFVQARFTDAEFMLFWTTKRLKRNVRDNLQKSLLFFNFFAAKRKRFRRNSFPFFLRQEIHIVFIKNLNSQLLNLSLSLKLQRSLRQLKIRILN